MIRVRFAPSPTGFLHIGGARTALFNWMYAKAQQGQFILRVEDTDQARSKQEFVDEILKSMEWLGLAWDEIYYQGERFDLYREHAQKLVDEGKAYNDNGAILLKMPREEIKIFDLIRGEINFDTANFFVRSDDGSPVVGEDGAAQLKDEVLIKTDGSPAYSFCCVVDDALMNISHVIRGEDHISNTPKQIVIYKALGFKIPKFAHMPLIMGDDGARLSKRTGAVAVSDYKAQGFLPEGLVNYLMLLGWSPGNNQEVVTLEAAVKKFSIKKVNKAAAVFSMEKLQWVNGQHIKKKSDAELAQLLMPILIEKGYINEDYDGKTLENIVKLYKGRMVTLVDFLDWADFLFVDQLKIDPELGSTFDLKVKTKEFTLLADRFAQLDDFSVASTEEVFRGLVDELGVQASELVHPVRVALTGKKVGPGLFDTIVLLGKDRTVERLKAAVQ